MQLKLRLTRSQIGVSSTTKVPLKYLFHVQYLDGTGMEQNEEDISKTDLKRSAFYDVKVDEVEWFTLMGTQNYSLHLPTGKFYAGRGEGDSFTVNDPGPKPYKLIFYRQHTHNFNMGLDEISHEVKYCIGYEDVDGVEHKVYVQ